MKHTQLLNKIIYRIDNIVKMLPLEFHQGNHEVFTLMGRHGGHMLVHNHVYRADNGRMIERIELFFVRPSGATTHYTRDLSMLTGNVQTMVGKHNENKAQEEYLFVKVMEEQMLDEAVQSGWL